VVIIIIIIIIITGRNGSDAVRNSPTVETTKLVEYVDRKEDPLMQVVRTHQHNTD